jgi:hypothetical protein
MATFWIIMKLTWNYLLIALLLNVTGLWATAQEESQIPATAWEQHPEGVALALMLTKGIGNDAQSIYLKLFVKNTSNSSESLATQSRGASALFFYLDSSGRAVTLGNHDHPDQPWKDEIESNPRWRIILPGKIIPTGTDVTAAEVAVIKANKVKCKILLIDPATQKQTVIVGSPQLLNPQSL